MPLKLVDSLDGVPPVEAPTLSLSDAYFATAHVPTVQHEVASRSLRGLALEHCPRLGDVGIAALGAPYVPPARLLDAVGSAPLPTFESLRTLSLRGCRISDGGIEPLIALLEGGTLPQLASLCLAGNDLALAAGEQLAQSF